MFQVNLKNENLSFSCKPCFLIQLLLLTGCRNIPKQQARLKKERLQIFQSKNQVSSKYVNSDYKAQKLLSIHCLSNCYSQKLRQLYSQWTALHGFTVQMQSLARSCYMGNLNTPGVSTCMKSKAERIQNFPLLQKLICHPALYSAVNIQH